MYDILSEIYCIQLEERCKNVSVLGRSKYLTSGTQSIMIHLGLLQRWSFFTLAVSNWKVSPINRTATKVTEGNYNAPKTSVL